jgi:hypothetical protein
MISRKWSVENDRRAGAAEMQKRRMEPTFQRLNVSHYDAWGKYRLTATYPLNPVLIVAPRVDFAARPTSRHWYFAKL